MLKRSAVLGLLLLVSVLYATDIRKEFQVEPGKTLFAEIEQGGSITVTGWDQNKVAVSITTRGWDCGKGDVKINERSGNVYIETPSRSWGRGRDCSIEVTAKVPAKFNLDLEITGGSVTIAGVAGEIKGKTMGGSLNFKDLSGSVDFSTMGGSIEVKDSNLEGELQTMGGNITFKNISGKLRSKTMGGNIYYDHSKGGPGGKFVTTTMGGNIEIDKVPYGADVNTMGGNILIDSAGDFVRAKTMGGNITIGKIDGAVDVSTKGGDVTVTVVGDTEVGNRDVSISSKGGDITLTLPASMSVDLDLELALTHRRRNDYQIICDFPWVATEEEVGASRFNEVRKYIYGKSPEKGGKHRVWVQTINGDIKIKKKPD